MKKAPPMNTKIGDNVRECIQLCTLFSSDGSVPDILEASLGEIETVTGFYRNGDIDVSRQDGPHTCYFRRIRSWVRVR